MISDFELAILSRSVETAYLIPYIDDVEDYVWEAIWHEAKELTLGEGLARTKRLFDVVDVDSYVGWSAKTLVTVGGNLEPGRAFEFVIQRADVIKKQAELGFRGLSLDSDPQVLGAAVMAHWRAKVLGDAEYQGVEYARMAILLKNRTRTEFSVMDEELHLPNDDELVWDWTNASRTGLQGRDAHDDFVRYRWYPNQTQLFERMRIPQTARTFELTPRKLELAELLAVFQRAGYIS